jgi:hypothetical protein
VLGVQIFYTGEVNMIFTRLQDRIDKTTALLQTLKLGSQEHELELCKLAAFQRIHEYIFEDVTWSKRESTAQRVFDALNLGHEEAAKLYNTTPQSIKSSTWQAANSIASTIGFDILKAIDECGVVLGKGICGS